MSSAEYIKDAHVVCVTFGELMRLYHTVFSVNTILIETPFHLKH